MSYCYAPAEGNQAINLCTLKSSVQLESIPLPALAPLYLAHGKNLIYKTKTYF